MNATSDETAPSLASALVRAGRAGSGRRIALSNETASGSAIPGSAIPLMDRRAFLGTLAGGLLTAPLAVQAHQAGKVYRIGMRETRSAELHAANIDAFRQGLRELG